MTCAMCKEINIKSRGIIQSGQESYTTYYYINCSAKVNKQMFYFVNIAVNAELLYMCVH